MPLLLLALYWLSALEAVSAHGILSIVGKFEMEIASPAPCLVAPVSNRTEAEVCDCFYQALLNENVSFTLVVNTTVDMIIAVETDDKKYGCRSTSCDDDDDQGHCATKHCDQNTVCTYSCSTDEQLSLRVNVQKFSVVASPYDRRLFGDTRRTVCVQVNETRSLKFQSEPGPQQNTSNGRATFVYIVDGYPLPTAYELVCGGRVHQRSSQGVFQLTTLSNGTHECFATASSRIANISSSVTRLTVENPLESLHRPSHELVVAPEPAVQDLYSYMIGGVASSVGAVIVMLVLAAAVARKVVSRRQSNVPPSVVNIHNDHSHHATYIHSGPKVESYGPNSTIIVDPVTAQLLKSGDDCDRSDLRDWIVQYGAEARSDEPESVTYTFVDDSDVLSRVSLQR